jgi:hypothetical protein
MPPEQASLFARSRQFGRMSAPMMPRQAQTNWLIAQRRV